MLLAISRDIVRCPNAAELACALVGGIALAPDQQGSVCPRSISWVISL